MESQLSRQYVKMLTGLFTFGCSLTKDEELVKDCIHDVFLTLCERSDLSDIRSLSFYIFRSFRNRLMKDLARKPLERTAGQPPVHPADKSGEDRYIAAEQQERLKTRLNAAFRCLTKRQKAVVHLYYMEQCSYDEIALKLNISRQVVKNIVHDALVRLRNELGNLPFENF